MRWIAFVAVLLILSTPGGAADPSLPKGVALVPNDALAFMSVNLAEASDHPAFRGFRDALLKSGLDDDVTKSIGIKLMDIERQTVVVVRPLENQRRPEPQVMILFTTRKPFDKAQVLKNTKVYTRDEAVAIESALGRRPGEKRPEPSGKTDAPYYVGEGYRVLAFPDDRTILFWRLEGFSGKVADVPNPLDLLKAAEATGPLTESLPLAAKYPLAAAANMTALKAVIANEKDALPPDAEPLLKADRVFGYISLNKETADVTAKASFAGKQWAADGEEAVQKMKDLALVLFKSEVAREAKRQGDSSAEVQLMNVFISAVQKATLAREQNTVVLTGAVDIGPKTQKLLVSLPGVAENANTMMRSANNLKQIGLAFHNYESTYQYFPANVHDKDGKPLLSWRVHVLPYLEQQLLYNQFKLDEPWDSDHNKKLIEKMPAVYALPGTTTKEAGHTFYLSFVAKKNGAGRPLFVTGEKKGPRIAAITDGTSNSLLCVEAAESVPWTKPDDLPFDPAGRLPKLGGHFAKDSFQAAFCDGSVRTLKTTLPEATLKAYVTINGGEVIDEK